MTYEVRVKCPYCGGWLDLNAEPYHDQDGKIGLAIFGKVDQPANWENVNAERTCNHCKRDFIVERIEY